MDKQYNISAELFTQIKDIFELLMMPDVFNAIKALDLITANDVRDAYIKINEISMQRMLSNMMRRAYMSGNMDAVSVYRETKKKLAEGGMRGK